MKERAWPSSWAMVLSDEAFAGVVRDGNLRQAGMPPFPDFGDEDLTALQHCIRAKAEG